MNRLLVAAIFAVGMTGLSATPAGARNYDCTKAGNANKAECKTKAAPKVATAAKPARKAAPAAKAITTRATAKVVAKTARTYDCSKAGNKDKAVCKTAATPVKPVVKQAATTTTTRNYDCAKAGNANKQACKTSVAKAVAMAKSVAMRRTAPAKTAAAADDKNPAGAIGRCKDGFFSHSKQRTGACSRHGGVAKWS